MSSHHIVRDEQEPALILGSNLLLDADWLGDLLAWSPVVVILEAALDKALSLGIKLDIVLCNTDNELEVQAKVAHQYPIEVIAVDQPTWQFALHYLKTQQHTAINVCLDQQQAYTALDETGLDVVFYQEKSRCIQSPIQQFEKWYRKNTILHVFDRQVSIQHSANLTKLSAHQYQVIADGLVRLQGNGRFWLQEPL